MRHHALGPLALGCSLGLAALACNREPGRAARDQPAAQTAAPDTVEVAPVALNANSPVVYPKELEAQGVEGRVLLKLFIDASGAVDPDSTRVAESSGSPGLDSAALAAVPSLRYAPALREGQAIAAPFIQPVYFRARNAALRTP